MNKPLKLGPDWETQNRDQLKKWRGIGLVFMVIGTLIVIKYVPTIKVWWKITGAIMFGIGINLFLAALKYLKKKD